jgi:hypothetical protein
MAIDRARGPVRTLFLVLLSLYAMLGARCLAGSDGEALNPVIVIFADGLVVSASGKSFVVEAAPGATGVPAGAELQTALAAMNERIAREDVWEVATVFPPGSHEGEHADEMKRIWSITLSASTPDTALEALAHDLGANPLVKQSYVQPTPQNAGGSTTPGPIPLP